MDQSHFRGRRYWLIGASAGIGAALARELAGQGARLVLSARSADDLQALAEACEGSPEVLPLDLAERQSIADAVDHLRDGAPLDGVISTAALYDPGRVSELDPEKAALLVRVNVMGTLHLAQLAPEVIRKGGQLVLFGSIAGYFGLPKGQAYSMTKAAVINLAETLRTELAPDVDVRLVSPGFVRTRLTDKNDFDMPALMEPEAAARAVVRGMAGRSFEIHFPKRLTLVLKLLRAVPYWASLPVVGRLR